MSQNDPWQEPDAVRWVNHVLEEMVPKLTDSALAVSIVPESRHMDVKFWVELGASICMDKPIIVVAPDDRPIPPKLEMIADEVVRSIDSPDELSAAITRVMENLNDGA